MEVYALAVQTGKGEGVDYVADDVYKEYASYVDCNLTRYLDDGSEVFPVTYNYERWLGSS